MTGVERIAAERQRQIDAEGWALSHDEVCHPNGELLWSAIAYAMASVPHVPLSQAEGFSRRGPCTFKPSVDPIRNLEKAGALIAAELDRLGGAR